MKVFFATRVRGFFTHLFSESMLSAELTSDRGSVYELNSKKAKFIRAIAKLPIYDTLGVIHTVKVKNKNCDIYGSFNRFLKPDKPYFIYVENPTALYHYRLNRKKSYLGARRIESLINNKYLQALVCMSQACKSTFEQVCAKVPSGCRLTQIYPLVQNNSFVNLDVIKDRCNEEQPIRLLYISQGLRFLSKGALEIVDAFKKMRSSGCTNVTLTMVTSLSEVDLSILNEIKQIKGISLCDFTFTGNDILKLYATHNIYLMPTSDDSFNITVLEAIKAGLPIVGTSLYAIPEMVQDNYNGYLTEPAYYFFDKNNVPNPEVWNHRDSTIYSGTRCESVTKFLFDKILYLYKNREELYRLSVNSYLKASQPPFSKDYIIHQWNELFEYFSNN